MENELPTEEVETEEVFKYELVLMQFYDWSRNNPVAENKCGFFELSKHFPERDRKRLIAFLRANEWNVDLQEKEGQFRICVFNLSSSNTVPYRWFWWLLIGIICFIGLFLLYLLGTGSV